MRVKYEIQTEKTDAQLLAFRKDLEVFKTNLIAAGQLTASYTLQDGNRLAQIVSKLQSDFEFFCRDSSDRQAEIQQDLGNKVGQFMSDTQGVFDSMLQDIAKIQKDISNIDTSNDLEILETHLTERIATLTENAMETSAMQSESLQNLHEQVQEMVEQA